MFNYIEILKSSLYDNLLIPAVHLAVWIYREKEWTSETTPEDIIEHFKNDFLLNEEEINQLFDIFIPENININQLFQDKVVSWEELKIVKKSATGSSNLIQPNTPKRGGMLDIF